MTKIYKIFTLYLPEEFFLIWDEYCQLIKRDKAIRASCGGHYTGLKGAGMRKLIQSYVANRKNMLQSVQAQSHQSQTEVTTEKEIEKEVEIEQDEEKIEQDEENSAKKNEILQPAFEELDNEEDTQ